jgi:hypothetical protein
MKTALLLAAAASSFALTAVLLVAVASSRVGHDHLYSADDLRDQLARDSVGWVGRTVLVRGAVSPCFAYAGGRRVPPCLAWSPLGLASHLAPGVVGEEFLLGCAGAGPMLAWLRQALPLGLPEPAAHAPHWEVLATYRVQITRLDPMICRTGLCYELVRQDCSP